MIISRDNKRRTEEGKYESVKKKTGIPLNVFYYLREKTLVRAVIFINNINVMHQSIETTAPEPRDIAGNLTFT